MEILELDSITTEAEGYRTEEQYEVGCSGVVHIMESDVEDDLLVYGVEEPELSEIERVTLRDIEQDIRDYFSKSDALELYAPEDLQAICESVARHSLEQTTLNISHLRDSVFGDSKPQPTIRLIGSDGPPVGAPDAQRVETDTRERLIYHVRKRTGFHELNTPVRDKHITSIHISGLDESVRVVHSEYGEMEANISFSADSFRRLARTLCPETEFDEEGEDEYEFETAWTEGTFEFCPASLRLRMHGVE